MSEWPLIAFTIAMELSCGLALAATVCDYATRGSNGFSVRTLGSSIFPVAAVGVLASLFHLGRPLSAWRALSNLASSRLSVEALLSVLFALAALGCSGLWWTRRKKGRIELGVVTSLLGLAAVVSSATVYLVPTEPAWNSPWMPVSFVGTTMLFCGLAPASRTDPAQGKSLRRIFLAATAAGAAAVVVSAALMVARLSSPPAGEFASARFHQTLQWLLSHGSFPLGIFVVLSGVLPMAMAFKHWTFGKTRRMDVPARLHRSAGRSRCRPLANVRRGYKILSVLAGYEKYFIKNCVS